MALPLLALAGLNVGNSILGGLWGASQQKKANEAAQAAEQRRMAMIRAAIARMGPNAQRYLKDLQGSPWYTAGLQSLFGGATQVGNTYNRSAAESGVNSGVRAAGQGLSNAAYAFARPGLDVSAQQLADERARAEMQAEVGGIGSVPMQYPGQTSFNPFAALAGPLAQYSLGQVNQNQNVPVTKQDAGWAGNILVPPPSPEQGPVNPFAAPQMAGGLSGLMAPAGQQLALPGFYNSQLNQWARRPSPRDYSLAQYGPGAYSAFGR